MNTMKIFIMTLIMFLGMGLNTVNAKDSADLIAVKAFYNDLLSNPKGEDLDKRVRKVVTEDWLSTPTPRGGKDARGLVDTLKGFGKAIPNLKWEIQEILKDGNRYIVRSKASGTPVLPVFGVEPKGNSFNIMTIDIHTVDKGLIKQSYHVEEWANAIRQLKGVAH